jgi:hypothetical protein
MRSEVFGLAAGRGASRPPDPLRSIFAKIKGAGDVQA